MFTFKIDRYLIYSTINYIYHKLFRVFGVKEDDINDLNDTQSENNTATMS